MNWLRANEVAFELPPGFEESDAGDDESDDGEIPIRATIQQTIGGQGVIRLGDAVEALENAAPNASFEYDVTIRIRSGEPLTPKERKAIEKRALETLITRPTFTDDDQKKEPAVSERKRNRDAST